MKTEIWDIIDQNGKKTGKTAVRGRFNLNPGEYHLVVHIWIVSSDNKILIQKRSKRKKLMPGEWAATGGAAITGETSFDAASRELFEEMGIKSNQQNLKKLLRIKRRNSLLDVWMIVTDTPIAELKLQFAEVEDARWVTKQELNDMILNGDFHNYGREYFSKVFEKIDEHKGAFI